MATLIQDLELFETIAGDVVAFASGQPVSTSKTIGSTTYGVSVVVLPQGPTGTQYQVFTGSVLSILGLVLQDAAEISGGLPVQIAEKIGNTWYGSTLTVTPATPASSASPAAIAVAPAHVE